MGNGGARRSNPGRGATSSPALQDPLKKSKHHQKQQRREGLVHGPGHGNGTTVEGTAKATDGTSNGNQRGGHFDSRGGRKSKKKASKGAGAGKGVHEARLQTSKKLRTPPRVKPTRIGGRKKAALSGESSNQLTNENSSASASAKKPRDGDGCYSNSNQREGPSTTGPTGNNNRPTTCTRTRTRNHTTNTLYARLDTETDNQCKFGAANFEGAGVSFGRHNTSSSQQLNPNRTSVHRGLPEKTETDGTDIVEDARRKGQSRSENFKNGTLKNESAGVRQLSSTHTPTDKMVDLCSSGDETVHEEKATSQDKNPKICRKQSEAEENKARRPETETEATDDQEMNDTFECRAPSSSHDSSDDSLSSSYNKATETEEVGHNCGNTTASSENALRPATDVVDGPASGSPNISSNYSVASSDSISPPLQSICDGPPNDHEFFSESSDRNNMDGNTREYDSCPTSPPQVFSDAMFSLDVGDLMVEENYDRHDASRISRRMADSLESSLSSATKMVPSAALKLSSRKKPLKRRKKKPTAITPGSCFAKERSGIDPSPTDTKPKTNGESKNKFATASNKRKRIEPLHPIEPRKTRSCQKRNADEVIDISSDSEAEIESLAGKSSVRRHEAIRIAVGKKVFSFKCLVRVDEYAGSLDLSFALKPASDTQHISFKLSDECISDFKYYVSDKEYFEGDNATAEFGFVAIRADPLKTTGLEKFTSSYHFDVNKTADYSRRFVVIEFPRKEVDEFIDELKEASPRSFSIKWDESKITDADIACKIAEPLFRRPTRHSRRSHPDAKSSQIPTDSDGTALVFPFSAKAADLEMAADGLKEIQQIDYSGQSKSTMDRPTMETKPESENHINNKAMPVSRGRAQFVTLRQDDYSLLDDFEFLNDNLIDFWMQWIQRGTEAPISNIHIFSTHFYSTLHDKSVDAVRSWTAKKSIDIFSKKLVFVPINMSLHWSLCILVNPGEVRPCCEYVDADADDPYPCMIFLDSLKAHNNKVICSNLRKWLNSEWDRLKRHESCNSRALKMFTSGNYPIITPEVPCQDNSWDCGVFVCKYAEAMFHLRDRLFSFQEAGMSPGDKSHPGTFSELVTRSKYFQFDVNNISQLRRDLQALIARLSQLFQQHKRERNKTEVTENGSKNDPAEPSSDEDAPTRTEKLKRRETPKTV